MITNISENRAERKENVRCTFLANEPACADDNTIRNTNGK